MGLDRIPLEDQEAALQTRLEVEEGSYFLVPLEVDIAKEGMVVVNRQKEAYHQSVAVGHYWKVGKRGIERVVVVHHHTMMIDHIGSKVRRSPAVDLKVDPT